MKNKRKVFNFEKDPVIASVDGLSLHQTSDSFYYIQYTGELAMWIPLVVDFNSGYVCSSGDLALGVFELVCSESRVISDLIASRDSEPLKVQ